MLRSAQCGGSVAALDPCTNKSFRRDDVIWLVFAQPASKDPPYIVGDVARTVAATAAAADIDAAGGLSLC